MRLLLSELKEALGAPASEPIPETMGLSAWLMLAFAIVVLLGGLLVCIRIAVVVGRRKREAGDGNA